jgi:hypothetical protein
MHIRIVGDGREFQGTPRQVVQQTCDCHRLDAIGGDARSCSSGKWSFNHTYARNGRKREAHQNCAAGERTTRGRRERPSAVSRAKLARAHDGIGGEGTLLYCTRRT